MKLSAELIADRATLAVQYQRTESLRGDSDPPPTSVRRPTFSVRPPSLSEEVERILTSHRQPQRPTPAPGSYRSTRPSIEHTSPTERSSEVQRSAERVSSTEHTSEVQPVAPRSAPPESTLPRPPAVPSELKRSKG